jgi:dienelactone hydrolase
MNSRIRSALILSDRRDFLRSLAGSVIAAAPASAAFTTRTSSAQESRHTVPSVHDRIRAEAVDAPLRMQFRGTSAYECRMWQAEFRAKLLELLGTPKPPAQWSVEREAEVRRDDHIREELVLTADGFAPLPLHVLRPLQFTGRLPAVLCVHGHGLFGHDAVAGKDDDPAVAKAIAESNYDYARQLVREGFITAAPCLTPFGRRLGDRVAYSNQDPCAVTFIRMQLLGRVLMGENLRDLLWTIDYLRARPDVKPDRLGCVGLSYGGRMTMLTAAVDPRIQVAVVSGALNVMQERVAGHYDCGAQVIPGLLQFGDVPEIGSLIAPRPCLWEVGLHDKLIELRWADIAIERMKRAYAAFGAADQLRIDRFDGGHRWNGVEAVPLLRRSLIK